MAQINITVDKLIELSTPLKLDPVAVLVISISMSKCEAPRSGFETSPCRVGGFPIRRRFGSSRNADCRRNACAALAREAGRLQKCSGYQGAQGGRIYPKRRYGEARVIQVYGVWALEDIEEAASI
mgnify:CR=1 FL=1